MVCLMLQVGVLAYLVVFRWGVSVLRGVWVVLLVCFLVCWLLLVEFCWLTWFVL